MYLMKICFSSYLNMTRLRSFSVLNSFQIFTKSFSTTTYPILPSQVDAIIIGGGITGCSILYQLAKRGIRAALFERGKITCGTTFHTAGLVWSLRPNSLEVEILKGTKKIFKELGEDDCGWIKNGSLFIAHSDDEVNEFVQLCTFGKKFGVESFMLGAKEATELFPLLDSTTFKAALYSPGDGVVDPSLLCNALVKASKHLGCVVFEDCNVNEILWDKTMVSKKVVGVATEQGIVKSESIVNARGLWSSEDIKINAYLPFVSMKHSYIVTETIPKLNRWPNIRDHNLSIYFRVQGQSLIVGGYESNPSIVSHVPNDFQFSLYEMDWTVFEPLMRNSMKLCPSLANIGVKSTICGPEAFSVDRKPLIGPDSTLQGLFHACAFSSNGMMLSGGVAEQLAEWMLNGKPSLDMDLYDLRRFKCQQAMNKAWIRQKCAENYSNKPQSKN